MIDLTGKTVIVTGGGAGIGLGIVRQCARAGATVFAFEINAECAAAVSAAGGSFVQVDLSEPEALAEAAAAVPICDGLVNNAGITIQKPLQDLSIMEMDRLWAINQRAILLMTQAMTPALAAGNGGAIVNVASNHARASARGYEAYAGTKGAIVAMTRAMAWSLGPRNIRVNALAPGLTLTEAITEMTDVEPELMQIFNSWHASGRVSTVDEIGKIAVFLLSDAATAITGTELIADHGMSARLGGL